MVVENYGFDVHVSDDWWCWASCLSLLPAVLSPLLSRLPLCTAITLAISLSWVYNSSQFGIIHIRLPIHAVTTSSPYSFRLSGCKHVSLLLIPGHCVIVHHSPTSFPCLCNHSLLKTLLERSYFRHAICFLQLTDTFQMMSSISTISNILQNYERVFYQAWFFYHCRNHSTRVAILLTRYIKYLFFSNGNTTQPVNTLIAIHFLHSDFLKGPRIGFFCVAPTECYFLDRENIHITGKGKIDCISACHGQRQCPVSGEWLKEVVWTICPNSDIHTQNEALVALKSQVLFAVVCFSSWFCLLNVHSS